MEAFNGLRITRLEIELMRDEPESKLLAFANIVLNDAFAICNLKVIRSRRMFVAMPSRKAAARCLKCGWANNLTADYCERCGERFEFAESDVHVARDGRRLYHHDLGFPVSQQARDWLEGAILDGYRAEVVRVASGG